MNILIIGDSWGQSLTLGQDLTQGIGNGVKRDTNDPGWKETLMEFDLMSKGHNVYNRSKYGSKNSSALADCEVFLNETRDIFKTDLIIWFYTSLFRDGEYFGKARDILGKARGRPAYDTLLQLTSNEISDYAVNIKNSYPDVKWAIIGGHAPIHDSEKYDWADFKIDDWRSELVGENVPVTQIWGWIYRHPVRLVDLKDIFGSEVILEEIEKQDVINKIATERTELFFDKMHVKSTYNRDLGVRILRELGLE